MLLFSCVSKQRRKEKMELFFFFSIPITIFLVVISFSDHEFFLLKLGLFDVNSDKFWFNNIPTKITKGMKKKRQHLDEK